MIRADTARRLADEGLKFDRQRLDALESNIQQAARNGCYEVNVIYYDRPEEANLFGWAPVPALEMADRDAELLRGLGYQVTVTELTINAQYEVWSEEDKHGNRTSEFKFKEVPARQLLIRWE